MMPRRALTLAKEKTSFDECIDHYISTATLKRWMDDDTSLEVLHVVGPTSTAWPMPTWFLEKSSRWTAQLKRTNIAAAALVPQALGRAITEQELFETLLRLKPKILVSRAFAIETAHLAWLALRAPGTTFVQMNHTPNSFMLGGHRFGPVSWLDAVEASQSLKNFWIGSVSSRDTDMTRTISPNAKACWIPNPCRDDLFADPDKKSKAENHRLTIGLAGRVNYQKNFKNQLDAVAIIGQQRPTALHLFIGTELETGMAKDLVDYARRYLKTAGVDVQVMPFIPPLELIDYAKQHLDIFLQVTFDESFGYLTWEMMTAAVPTISSPSPEITGVETADPTNVIDIAKAITSVAKDIDKHRKNAVEKAKNVQINNNKNFNKFFNQRLTDSLY